MVCIGLIYSFLKLINFHEYLSHSEVSNQMQSYNLTITEFHRLKCNR